MLSQPIMSSMSGAAHDHSQPPSSPSYNNDTEAASQQLLAESSPLRDQRAAIRASQLNLARINALPKPPAMAPSSLAGKPGKLGKLKRVSFPEQPQRKARGAKVYDIEPSPQKRGSLPTQIAAFEEEEEEQEQEEEQVPLADEAENRAPETSQAERAADQSAENTEKFNLPAQDSTAENRKDENMPASLGASLQEDASSATHKSPNRALKRKSTDRAASARPSDTSTTAVQRADDRISAMTATWNGKPLVVKKQRLLKGPRFVDLDTDPSMDILGVPLFTTQSEVRPHGDPHPEVQIPIRSTRRRVLQADIENAADAFANPTVASASASAFASGPREQPSRPLRVTKLSSKRKFSKEAPPDNNTVEPDEENNEDVEKNPHTTAAQRKGGAEPNGERDEADGANKITENGKECEKDNKEHAKEDKELDREASDPAATPSTKVQSNRLSMLDKVFQYTDSEQRPGVCLTSLGKRIHRTCDTLRDTISQSGEGLSIEDAVKCNNDITNLLRSIDARVKEGRRLIFKVDAFAHLFRALTLVFKTMHAKLQEREGDTIKSLETMQILHSYVREMLKFKDGIDAWKVKIPQRESGDRLIKDVECLLITPLRAVEKEFRVWLRQLESAQRIRQAHLDLQRKQEAEEQELVRKEEELSARRERRKRWQDLHIVRMQCEPDPARRRRLRFFEPVKVVEVDANGDQFERVPFFGERSMPRPQWAAVPSSREWTEEQETVLLDALQSTASLEELFRAHCGPGGALRGFSVSDIAVKLAWVRSGWSQLSLQHGWEIPDWVKNIPVLP